MWAGKHKGGRRGKEELVWESGSEKMGIVETSIGKRSADSVPSPCNPFSITPV